MAYNLRKQKYNFKDWSYQMGNRRTENTMTKKKMTKDKQWSTKYYTAPQISQKSKGELRCSERVISSWSTSCIRHATLAKRQVVSKSGNIYCDLSVVLVCLIPILYWFIFRNNIVADKLHIKLFGDIHIFGFYFIYWNAEVFLC